MKKFEETTFLILDCVSDGIYVAIFYGDKEITSKKLTKEESRRSESVIFCLIKEIFVKSKMTFADIDCHVVGIGVGSWTGARIGVSIIKALCLANKKPILGIVEDIKIETIKQKYNTNEFTRIEDLEPYYDGKPYVVK